MDSDEIRRRFRLVALGYAIFAVCVFVGMWINYNQSQDIKHNTESIRRIACELVRIDEGAQIKIAESPSLEQAYRVQCNK